MGHETESDGTRRRSAIWQASLVFFEKLRRAEAAIVRTTATPNSTPNHFRMSWDLQLSEYLQPLRLGAKAKKAALVSVNPCILLMKLLLITKTIDIDIICKIIN